MRQKMVGSIGRNDDAEIIEYIYAVTDEWEWLPMRLPLFTPFNECDVSTDDVANIIADLRKRYTFEVAIYPECLADIIDMVQCRPLRRLQPPRPHIELKPFAPKRTLIDRIKLLVSKI